TTSRAEWLGWPFPGFAKGDQTHRPNPCLAAECFVIGLVSTEQQKRCPEDHRRVTVDIPALQYESSHSVLTQFLWPPLDRDRPLHFPALRLLPTPPRGHLGSRRLRRNRGPHPTHLRLPRVELRFHCSLATSKPSLSSLADTDIRRGSVRRCERD
ncbi:hypothetical protein MC885_015182, partial [Smutsia gigantea]